MINSIFYRSYIAILIFILISNSISIAQHRGDKLLFQGLDEENGTSVKTAAMGGADIAGFGDLSSIFSNPAGLAGIKRFQISAAVNNYEKKWWENQVYRPNRQFVTLPFYLEGLYTPNPENNGKWDNDAFFTDSTYIVNDPALGLDSYSEEAAKWNHSENKLVFNNIAIALPFKLFDYSFVLSGAYTRQNNILDFDKNPTYLDPHIGFNGYAPLEERVVAAEDSVRVNWFDYTRSRSGEIKRIAVALSSEVTDYLNVGINIDVLSGESDDFYSLNKIGYFDLMGGANKFKFSYDTLNTSISGTSNYSAVKIGFGSVLNLNRLNIGVKLTAPYSFIREWQYQNKWESVDSSSTLLSSGKDELKVPLTYGIGLSFSPTDNFRIAFDVEKTDYASDEFSLSTPDSIVRTIPNQTILRAGAEYKVFEFLTLLAGYRNKTALFVPDGAAVKNRGPNITTYTVGLSVTTIAGRIDIAYETRRVRYYDSYYSNTNYNSQTYRNLLFGYTFSF